MDIALKRIIVIILVAVVLDTITTQLDIFVFNHGFENHRLPALFMHRFSGAWIILYPIIEFAVVFVATWIFHLAFVRTNERSRVTLVKYVLVLFLYVNDAHNFSIMLFGQPILPNWL